MHQSVILSVIESKPVSDVLLLLDLHDRTINEIHTDIHGLTYTGYIFKASVTTHHTDIDRLHFTSPTPTKNIVHDHH